MPEDIIKQIHDEQFEEARITALKFFDPVAAKIERAERVKLRHNFSNYFANQPKEERERMREINKRQVAEMHESMRKKALADLAGMTRGAKINWMLAERPTLYIYVEKGVPDAKVADSVAGMKRLVVDKYQLNMAVEVVHGSDYISSVLGEICSTPGIITTGMTGQFRSVAERLLEDHIADSDMPHGSIVITSRKFSPFSWGITHFEQKLAVVSSAYNNDIGPISAHELMHYTGLDGQQHTKGSESGTSGYRNCNNHCLMNYRPAPDGKLCSPCETGLIAYSNGLDLVMKQHSRSILRA